jgi:hypothetical protein
VSCINRIVLPIHDEPVRRVPEPLKQMGLFMLWALIAAAIIVMAVALSHYLIDATSVPSRQSSPSDSSQMTPAHRLA